MKYEERLTQWVADGASLILDNPTTAEEARQQVIVQFKKACIKLAELEDKIENGELVQVPQGAVVLAPEERDEERKQAVIKFVEELKNRYFYMTKTYMGNPIYQCTGDELDRLVKEVYGE